MEKLFYEMLTHLNCVCSFQGLVTSTLKPLESGCLKDDVFVTTFHSARNFTDQWANLNFIVRMKKMTGNGEEGEVKAVPVAPRRPEVNAEGAGTSSNNNNNTAAAAAPATQAEPVQAEAMVTA